MIKHIVCFKLKDNNEDNCTKTAQLLMSMKGKVPQIIDIEVGVDFLHSPRSYDIILQVTLENDESLNEYQQDDYHCSVVKKHMHSVMESSVAIDYNI